MFKNYLSAAFRNLRKYTLHTALNLGGLSIGLACCLLIALYIREESRYDRYHAQADRIWRVTRTFHEQDGSVNLHLSAIAPPFATYLKDHFPEIQVITRTLQNNGSVLRTSNNQLFPERNLFFADENLFKVFTVPMLAGDPQSSLSAPWQIALSERAAKRYFGEKDPLNQVLQMDSRYQFKVTGVFRDFPAASHWHPEVLLSFASLRDSTLYGEDNLRTNYSNNAFYTYFAAAPGFDPNKMSARFPAFLDEIIPSKKVKPSSYTQLHLQKLTDIHLKSHHDDEIEPGGDSARVQLFGVIAILILLIAGMNYINLATAFSLGRAKEIGVRKSSGAQKGQLIAQFLLESLMMAGVASLIACGLAALGLLLLKQGVGINLGLSALFSGQLLAGLAAVTFITGLLSGLYPAFFLSSFKPVLAMKGAASAGKSNSGLRKGLVIVQFGAAVLLLVSTLVIYRQLTFMQEKSLGLDKTHIVTLNQNNPLLPKWDAFRSELLKNPNILNVSRSSRLPAGRLLDDLGGTSVQLGDTMTPLTATLKMLATDLDFVPTYQIPLAAGRAFSRDFPTDTTQAWLLNEAATRVIGWKSPEDAVGKRLIYGGRTDCYVVGVLKDFHFESLHQEIVPMIFFIPRDKTNLFSISVKTGANTTEALAHLKQVWQQFNADFPCNYAFLDEDYGQLYAAEIRQGRLYLFFSGLAIFVACLGLFGLATFAAHQRTKEIGIRKVLGATVSGITGLLAQDFLKLVVLAIVVASPIAWYLMNRWLQDFAYRIHIQWWMFALAGLLALAIAFFTVSFQSVKAALTNPVKSLRSE